MTTHYAATGTIRYYRHPLQQLELKGGKILAEYGPDGPQPVNLRQWKEPPHVALANLLPDDKAVLAFTRRYGLLPQLFGQKVSFGPSRVFPYRDFIRGAWTGEWNWQEALESLLTNQKPSLKITPAGLEIHVERLWALILMLFMQDKLTGRARVCASPDCPAPYFLAVRRGQKFCSQRCAVLINVRRFRKNQAKQQEKGVKLKPSRRGKHAKAKKA